MKKKSALIVLMTGVTVGSSVCASFADTNSNTISNVIGGEDKVLDKDNNLNKLPSSKESLEKATKGAASLSGNIITLNIDKISGDYEKKIPGIHDYVDLIKDYFKGQDLSKYTIKIPNEVTTRDINSYNAPFGFRKLALLGFNIDLSNMTYNIEEGASFSKYGYEGLKEPFSLTLKSKSPVWLDLSNVFKNSNIKKLDMGDLNLKPDDPSKYGSPSDPMVKEILDRLGFDLTKPLLSISSDSSSDGITDPEKEAEDYSRFYNSSDDNYKKAYYPKVDSKYMYISTGEELTLRARADVMYNMSKLVSYKEAKYGLYDDSGKLLKGPVNSSNLLDFREALGELGDKVVTLKPYIEPVKEEALPELVSKVLTIKVGDNITVDDVAKLISRKDGKPLEGVAKFDIVKPLDTSKAGDFSIDVRVYFSNGKSEDVKVPVTIKEPNIIDKIKSILPTSYKTEVMHLFIGDKVDNVRSYIKGLEASDKVKVIDNIDTSKEGAYKAKIEVIHSDGSVTSLVLDYEVKAKVSSLKHSTPKSYSDYSLDLANSNLYKNATKLIGTDRVKTSYLSSRSLNSDTVVFASADKFSDALSSSNLVNKFGYKLILIRENSDIGELVDGNIKNAYIIGGEKSISLEKEKEIRAKVANVYRLAGKDRYETNEDVLNKAGYKDVVVVDGRNYPDALSAFSLMNYKGLGLRLDSGDNNIGDYNGVYTVGGEKSVSKEYGIRVAGSDRYATNYEVNKLVSPNFKTIVFTDGENFPDALSASNLLKSYDGVLVLARGGIVRYNDGIYGGKTGYILGGLGL